MPTQSPLVQISRRGRVLLITLNSPPANCYSYEMMEAFDAAVLQARFDNDIQAIVVTGAGNRFFCAGADIEMLNTAAPAWKYNFCLHANETLLRLENTPKLVVAAINGHCVGGGLEVALACDMRFVRQDAGKIGLPEVKLGLLPGTGGTARLTRLLGKSRALELMVEGKLFDTKTALELGIVNAIIDAADRDQFLDAVLDRVSRLCSPEYPAMAVGCMKRSVQAGAGMTLYDHLALEREMQQRLFMSEDAREGISAYIEKRAPQFNGQ